MPLQRLDVNADRRANDGLLSPVGYDDDAASIHSRSDQDSDSDDDELQLRARNSHELRAADRLVLMEEEETDKLIADSRKKKLQQRRGSGLTVPNPLKMLGRRGSMTRPSSADSSTVDLVAEKRKDRTARRKAKKNKLMEEAAHGEDGHLMYEIEEGGLREGSSTGDSSDRDEDKDEMMGMMTNKPSRRGRQSWTRWLFIHGSIAVGFGILLLVAWRLSGNSRSKHASGMFVDKQTLLSNGTALFGPTTIIISLDGFRADFLQRGITPRLNAFVKEGVSPKYMLPSFPSVTFPNHYTLATGLYPESHGVVGNSFWDPELKEEFYYTDPKRSLDPKWWGGEPFWVTAEKQGLRSAVHMWPGSEAHVLDIEPSFIDKYNGKEKLERKVDRIFEFLDKPGHEDKTAAVEDTRAQLIAAYVPNVDAHGHKFGPNSTEIRATIASADTMVEQIFQGLEQRNLTDIVNVIVVSDHGMATTDTSRLLQAEELIEDIEIEHEDGWPLFGLRPKHPEDEERLYTQLKNKSINAPFEAYRRDVDMPERYHFSNNDRIAPVWIVPETGWAIVKKSELNVAEAKEKGLVYHPRGLHGYDHEHPLMRAIFIARGPAFPHPANSEMNVFQNIDVYNMLCDSLGLEPAPNNGTQRLPLRPIGMHKPEDTPAVPEDPVKTTAPARPTLPDNVDLNRPVAPTGQDDVNPRPTIPAGSKEGDEPTVDPPGNETPPKETGDNEKEQPGTGTDDDNEDEEEDSGFWTWLKHKVGKIWDDITGSKEE